ncbi:MAG TPA: TIGR02147 family protein [Bdellovibrionota bacterium]|nr:TIGR02147 family protein [Bdellovibrionota bacterium]
MTYETEDYRSFLKRALAERSAKNAAFSISAFARKLGIGRSFLSEVLAGKKNLSSDAAAQVATRLGLSADESEYFTLLVRLGTHSDARVREHAVERISELRPEGRVHDLSVDLFRTISDWHHLPILELTFLKGFEFNARNVARKLGISIFEAEAAIDRLLRLELLEKSEGKIRKTPQYVFVESKVSHQAVIQYHRKMLEKASRAVEEQSPAERKGRTEALALDPELLPEAEAILDRAAEELTKLANKSKSPKHVYAASLHLFNLTSERKKS